MAISQVIKHEGDNGTFIWKHPCEDFNTSSQLIVHETQEAIFFRDGRALELFGPGRYTLETENIPVLKSITNLTTGGETAFHCEVYFINKTEQMAIRWGTNSKIQYIEPMYGFPISIGASGEMSLKVADSRKVLIKLVGTEHTLSQERINTFFRAFLNTKVKAYIAQEIKTSSINIFEIDEKLETLSAAIKGRLDADFLEYGMKLCKFFVTTIVKPDGEAQYEKYKDLRYRQYADIAESQLKQKVGIIEQETKAKQMVIESQGIAKKRAIEGYTYQQERGFDVAEGAAKNEGNIGNLAGMGIGLGMMTGIGNTVGGIINNSVGNAFADMDFNTQNQKAFCDKCGAELTPGALYCDNCGEAQADICSNCGFRFVRAGRFCPRCGSRRNNSI